MNRVFCRVVFLAFTWTVWVSSPASESSALYGELLQRSGLAGEIQQLPEVMVLGLKQGASGENTDVLTSDILQNLARAARRAYSPGVIKARVLAHLRQNMPLNQVQEALSWYNSPVGRKIARLESESSTPEAQIRIEQYAANLANENYPEEKVALIQALAEDSGAIESGIEIALNTQKAIAAAALAASATENLSSLPYVLDQVEKYRPRVAKFVTQNILVSMLFTYQTLSKEELAQYLEFIRTESGTAFQALSLESLKRSLGESGLRFGKSMAEILEALREQRAS